MSYTIIGQNNGITTLEDENGHILRVPSRAVIASDTTFTLTSVNNNMATLEDSNGKIYRDIPCVVDLVGSGGGGGSSLPDQTGHSGEFLTTDGTDASWGVVEALPDQTGQSGKFLTTDGTDASWSDKPLVNKAEGYQSVVINTNPDSTTTQASGQHNVMVGFGARVNHTNAQENTIVGYGANVSGNKKDNVIIGSGAESYANFGTAVGKDARVSADYAIQIGRNGQGPALNSDANTFKVANENGNYELMSADGTIPAARHASLPATDGTYVLKLVISSGVPTLSWVAE